MPSLNIPVDRLEIYLARIREDYVKFWKPEDLEKTHIQDMITEFNQNLTYKIGNSYIKVIQGSSVHSFIVNKTGKFPVGSILMAASWKAPATNFARGNILQDDYVVRWTGAIYLK